MPETPEPSARCPAGPGDVARPLSRSGDDDSPGWEVTLDPDAAPVDPRQLDRAMADLLLDLVDHEAEPGKN